MGHAVVSTAVRPVIHELNEPPPQIVPCMAQARTDDGNCYRASGWLGIITAGKLW